jgi:NADPH:quinone reductase-like Zn-dependent oxidoreductase
MKAAWRERYGPPGIVEIRDLEEPVPKAGEVLVRVHAASVNRADLDALYARWAFLRLFLGLRRPRNRRLGIDAAGVVEAVGPGVTRFRAGDRVFGDLFSFGQDAYSELVCAPERAFATIPDALPFEEAATLPHAGTLAMQGLRRRDGRGFEPRARVLIVGASGSVGPFAVQIAKAGGAHVTGVASTDKLDLVRSLGADEVIDYTAADCRRPAGRYDWIVDVNAHHSVLSWRHAVAPGGVYAALGGDSAPWFIQAIIQGPALSLASRRHMGLMLHWKPFHAPDVEALLAMVSAGQVRPVIDRGFPLTDLAAALRYVDEGRARGKVVITII